MKKNGPKKKGEKAGEPTRKEGENLDRYSQPTTFQNPLEKKRFKDSP